MKTKVHKHKSPGKWRAAFLAAYRRSGVITHAAAHAKVTRTCVYKTMREDEDFRREVNEAGDEATEFLEMTAVSRATSGPKPSDILLIFLLKARKPETYRERHDIQHTGAGGGPIGVTFSPEDREQLGAALEKRISQRVEERNRFVDGMVPVNGNGNGHHNGNGNGNGNGFSDPH